MPLIARCLYIVISPHMDYQGVSVLIVKIPYLVIYFQKNICRLELLGRAFRACLAIGGGGLTAKWTPPHFLLGEVLSNDCVNTPITQIVLCHQYSNLLFTPAHMLWGFTYMNCVIFDLIGADFQEFPFNCSHLVGIIGYDWKQKTLETLRVIEVCVLYLERINSPLL